MKSNRFAGILVLAIILALLGAAVPATPALAAVGTITTLYPSSGPVGTPVNIAGIGFTASSSYTVHFSTTPVAYGTCDTSGNLTSRSFSVPAYPKGTFPITVRTNQNDTSDTLYFTITSQLTPSTTVGHVGNTVTISGTGFAASSNITFYFDSTGVSAGTTTTNASGSFTNNAFTIPAGSRGTHTIKAQDASGNYATATFTTMQKITLSSTSGAAGDQVTVSGTGFAASSNITFYFDSTGVSAGTTTTNASGSFTNNAFTIPASSWGTHTIKAQDASGNYATATFTTMQKITLSSTSGAAGDQVTVSGTGFAASSPITLTFNGTVVATTTSDNGGSFSAVFAIPLATVNGTYKVEASDGTYKADASLAISAGISLGTATSQAAPGHAGMELTVSGKGFIANATVTVTYATEPVVVATVTADAVGAFSATFAVPESTAGAHTITATDGTNIATSTFVMEAAPPPVPVPLLPYMDAKAKSTAYFDWEEVTDPSGVTYRLQIASSEDFSEGAMVLDKGGITASEYTLTKEEKLESTKKDAPYYWRVKAVDGASNESGWTTPGTFYSGFTFELTGWILYLLYGLGGLVLLFIGFLLGRRSAIY